MPGYISQEQLENNLQLQECLVLYDFISRAEQERLGITFFGDSFHPRESARLSVVPYAIAQTPAQRSELLEGRLSGDLWTLSASFPIDGALSNQEATFNFLGLPLDADSEGAHDPVPVTYSGRTLDGYFYRGLWRTDGLQQETHQVFRMSRLGDINAVKQTIRNYVSMNTSYIMLK